MWIYYMNVYLKSNCVFIVELLFDSIVYIYCGGIYSELIIYNNQNVNVGIDPVYKGH